MRSWPTLCSLKVDTDAEPELAQKYDVQRLPTLLIFVKGKVEKSFFGFTAEAALRASLKELSRYVATMGAASWQKDVLDASTPVLVDFSATWCAPCRRMEPALEALAKDFSVVKVDVDAEPELAQKYEVQSLPTLLIFVNGKVENKFVGLTGEAELRAKLQELSKRPAPG